MHVIPRTPSPVPLTKRDPDKLSREEMLALITQQKQTIATQERVGATFSGFLERLGSVQ